MNSRQMAKYCDHYTERTSIWKRHVKCDHCGWSASMDRAGQNAMAASQKLFGRVAAHLREAHPEKLNPPVLLNPNEE